MKKTLNILSLGGVVAYPCEGVFGLGCDPFSQAAVERLLEIKGRQSNKGFILLIAHWAQAAPYIDLPLKHIEKTLQDSVHTTWVFPATSEVPSWISSNQKVAFRVIALPSVRKICETFGPLVSTSANLPGEDPARSIEMVRKYFGDRLDGIFPGDIGSFQGPSRIVDVLTQEVLRD